MVTYFMGDNVCHGEITGCAKLALELLVKRKVDIDLMICRAIKRAAYCACEAALRLNVPRKKDKHRFLIFGALLFKKRIPHIFGVFQHNGNELCFFIIRGGVGLNCFRTLIEVFKRVLAHQKGENNDNNTAHSSADGEPTHSAAILDVTASLSSCP